MNDPDALGADTLGRAFVKVPVAQFMAMVQRSKTGDVSWLLFTRNGLWGLAGGLCVVAGVLTLLRVSGSYHAEPMLLNWLWVGTVGSLFGALHTQASINLRRNMAKADETKDELRSEIRDARPADAVALGEMAAELQASRGLVRQMREEIAANERQRQADFDLIRENSRKALEGLHQEVEWAVLKAQREAYAAGIRDVIDEIQHHRAERYRDGVVSDAPSLHDEIRRYLDRQPRDDE